MSDLRALDDELLAALDAHETLDAQPRLDPKQLANARYRVSRAIMARRKYVDALLRKAMAGGGDKARIARAEQDRIMAVRIRYTAHIGAWSLAAIAGNERGYRAAAAELRDAIRLKLVEQRSILYPWVDLAP